MPLLESSDYTQTDSFLSTIDPKTMRLLPGKILIKPDPLPTKEGSIVLPDRDARPDHPAWTGTVMAVGYGAFPYDEDTAKKKGKRHPGLTLKDVKAGDRVVYRLLGSDLNRKLIFTDIRRVDAVIES